MAQLEVIAPPPKFSQPCDLCGFSHGPVDIYVDWINRFGKWHVFKEGKRAGQPTMRTAQTQRWEALVARHSSGDRQARGGLGIPVGGGLPEDDSDDA